MEQTRIKAPLFSTAAIRRLILPLIIEQFLAVMVGMADTVMIASVGEAAVSGISLVDTLNILLINVFTALATGGAVVSSHYLGGEDKKTACKAADQLVLVVLMLSAVITAASLIFNYQILRGIYGRIEPAVMSYARTYYYLTALSFPFLAVYNGCAAICRSMGNSFISMKVSALMNAINIVGNACLIFGFHMEVAGAGISTLTSRVAAAVIMVCVVRNQKLPLHISRRFNFRINRYMVAQILHVGIPVAIENGLFQGGKLMVAGLISSFGTVSIAANAVSNTIASFQVIPGTAIGLAIVTVVGQSVGAKRFDEAKKYTIKLCMLVAAAHFAICLPMTLGLRQIIGFYGLSQETADLAWTVSMIHGICCVLIWPPSFALPNALRAADDAKFAMVVTVLSMAFARVLMSYVLGRYFGLGLVGVWIAMILDWVVRDVVYLWRFFSGGWLKKHLLSIDRS
ncbi:MATE family efflux transporter [Clostridium sp. MCC353]|uniref:MATE family efflux transporter n=1 Tax=Clostridium sp. MCC353 TaxID=2592646 RepID=UPI001C011753|nr:MATE family efflux transporter [Clostridium sp. MCC353]MBT9778408.1 MATE family efflux transporter [Clostridium sp. MCC353]